MQQQIEHDAREFGFRLARINYAGAHVVMAANGPPVVLVAGTERVSPRQVLKRDDGTRRLIWVFPPEWAHGFPREIQFFYLDQDGERLLFRLSGAEILSRRADAESLPAQPAHRAPFPPQVIDFVSNFGQRQFDPLVYWDDAEMSIFVRACKRTKKLSGRAGYAGPLGSYFGYLRRLEAACLYALNHFPDVNTTALRPDRYHSIASHPDEMMAIIHHLYVLNAAAPAGDFAEFGCFKGFSTSCLSRACDELGMRMHVFDSFAGLPPSSSGRYIEGEYQASLDEVMHHVRQFGVTKAIQWHKGFFADSLVGFQSPLSCIWMDVDLQESARDVMGRLELLDPQGCIFSHELADTAFRDGRVNADALKQGRFEVLPPIVDAIEARGENARGEHIVRSLGVIYGDRSIQVLPHKYVAELLALTN